MMNLVAPRGSCARGITMDRTLGERLAAARKEAGYTQKEAADILGISSGAIGMYETDKRSPDPDMLRKFATLYRVDGNYLLGSGRPNIDISVDFPHPSKYADQWKGIDPEIREQKLREVLEFEEFKLRQAEREQKERGRS